MEKPTLEFEQNLWQAGKRRVVGLDEVGRGAFCGCVVAAAVVLPPGVTGLEEVRDSKTLSAQQRERLVSLIYQNAEAVGIGAASPAEIDRLNIRRATALAMQRALRRIGEYDHLLVDGHRVPELGLAHQTNIIKGDSRSLSIASASVVAKVCRDRLLHRLAGRYPGYGWERNVGYGTAEHQKALQDLGVTPHHRRSFAPVRLLLAESAGEQDSKQDESTISVLETVLYP
ncbi:MAG TPA: ribonuclease HII [Chloroflexia bacterium]|nr:ribonuclease HII [Chloroflexia bacterium]